MIITKLPPQERPREKLMRQGCDALSNTELLAILIRTGTKDRSAVSLAGDILSMDKSGVLFLQGCSPEELQAVKGIGRTKACQIMAAVELGKRMADMPRKERVSVTSPGDIAKVFMEQMRYLKKEFFKVLLLDAKGRIISVDDTAVGDLCSAIVHPREVFNKAVRRSAAAVVLVHNHPSGDPNPSDDDIKTTKRLTEAGNILGINVLDHIIIGDGAYISLRNEKLLT